MARVQQIARAFVAGIFNMPYLAGGYNPGYQPVSNGESKLPYFPNFDPTPWPNAVGTVNARLTFPGIARGQAINIDNNATATLPGNTLYLGGVVGKSRG